MYTMAVISFYKQKGETPLQGLERVRRERGIGKEVAMTHVGRLDPMAEGVMMVLSGEDVDEREKYLGLSKTYRTEILCGVGTDTGDVLGLVDTFYKLKKFNKFEIKRALEKFKGTFVQKYPQYSSKSFAGAYEDVREGKVTEHTHEVHVFDIELLGMREISPTNLLRKIETDIATVSGDFRQQEVLQKWKEILGNKYDTSYLFRVLEIRMMVSSGFYVRQFAEDIGRQFNLPALALSIIRERVGQWDITSCEIE